MDIRLQEISQKAAGMYFLVYDNSKQDTVPTSSVLRLFPVNLRQGPVGTLVYVKERDFAGFKELFGDISRKDERAGNFSARSCLIALESGPILVLNMRSFNNTLDLTDFMPMGTVTTVENGQLKKIPYTSLFNTDRLWVSAPSNLLDDATALSLNFANAGSKNISIFVRKAKVLGYNMSIKTYYEQLGRPMPGFVNPNDKMVDTMIEVYAFSSDLSNNTKNIANEKYGHLFTENGLKLYYNDNGTNVDALSMLANITEAGFVGKYQGSLIPGATDFAGNSIYIENIINAATQRTGLMVKFNDQVAEQLSDWEPALTEDGKIDYASDNAKRPFAIDLVGHKKPTLNASALYAPTLGDTTSFATMLSYARSLYRISEATIDLVKPEVIVGDSATADEVKLTVFCDKPVDSGDGLPEGISSFYTLDLVPLVPGGKLVGRDGNLVNIKSAVASGVITLIEGLHTHVLPLQASGELFPKTNDVYVYPVGHPQAGSPVEYDAVSDAPLSAPLAEGGTAIPMPVLTAPQLANLRSLYGDVYNVVKVETDGMIEIGDITTLSTAQALTITLDNGTTIANQVSTRVFTFREYYESPNMTLKAINLQSYKPREAQFCDGTRERQKEILDQLIAPNIIKGIKALEINKPRYVVDAFKSFIETNFKYQYVNFAYETMCRALINEPFVSDMMKSQNPYFKTSPTGSFDISYIVTGGNRQLVSTNAYGKPVSDGDYAAYYFGPGLTADYFGTPIIIPPAAGVSKAFLSKLLLLKPYTICANDDGIFTGANITGVEYQFTDEERKYLEEVGYNAILYKARKGLTIYGNNTAHVTVKTSLSKIHSAELVLFIQEQMRAIFEDFIFKFNNYQNRLTMKNRADRIMNPIQDGGGVIWYVNICDESNNTDEIINNDMGVLDTHFRVGRGMEKLVHRAYFEKGGSLKDFAIISQ